MMTFFSAQAINVFSIENIETWDYPEHKHHFYELILVEKGQGFHMINNVKFPYKAKDVFLLTPSDSHQFLIGTITTFKYVKFTEQIFAEKLEETPNAKWLEIVEQAIINSRNLQGDIIICDSDRDHIFALYTILASEYGRVCLFGRYALLDIFGALLSIIARNLRFYEKTADKQAIATESSKITSVLLYIRQNIRNPENLSIKHLADVFHLSPAYLGIFIKKHTGYNIQNIITSTRLKMAEQLLTQSEFSISEIAYQLGFTDSSHFNKTIKKHMGINPKDMRLKRIKGDLDEVLN